MARTCEKNGLLGLDFYLVKWYNTTMYNRLETFQHILAAIEQLPNNVLVFGYDYSHGNVDAVGALAPYNGLSVDKIIYRNTDYFSEEFEKIREKYDSQACCEVELLADGHTEFMLLHERHAFMVRALIQTIENGGKWRLENFAELCPLSNGRCNGCSFCYDTVHCPCIEMEKDRQGIQRSKETNRRFAGLMSGWGFNIS